MIGQECFLIAISRNLGERFFGDGDLFFGAGEGEAFLRGEGDSLCGGWNKNLQHFSHFCVITTISSASELTVEIAVRESPWHHPSSRQPCARSRCLVSTSSPSWFSSTSSSSPSPCSSPRSWSWSRCWSHCWSSSSSCLLSFSSCPGRQSFHGIGLVLIVILSLLDSKSKTWSNSYSY